MKRLYLLCLLLVAGCQPNPDPMAGYWLDWGDEQLQLWVEQSSGLADAVQNYCAADSSLEDLQQAWRSTFLRWSSINGFPYKGISDLALEFELYFWPDRRNRVAGQLQRSLDSGESISMESLETRIAAEKGLAALEWLIFTPGPAREDRCRLLPATARDYAAKVGQISDYHQQNPVVQQSWLDSEAGAQSHSIALNLLYAQVTGLESRVQGSLDEDFTWLSEEAIGWRSGTTWASLQTSLQSLLDQLTYTLGRPELSSPTTDHLQGVIAEGQAIAQRMSAQTGTQTNAPLAEDLVEWLDATRQLINGDLSGEFNVLIGFNNFDGD